MSIITYNTREQKILDLYKILEGIKKLSNFLHCGNKRWSLVWLVKRTWTNVLNMVKGKAIDGAEAPNTAPWTVLLSKLEISVEQCICINHIGVNILLLFYQQISKIWKLSATKLSMQRLGIRYSWQKAGIELIFNHVPWSKIF